MTVTRDKAQRLLNKSEMVLFGDSRNPALRAFSAAELGKRVERTRTLRDKARDMLQRQKLGSRARTGSKSGALGDANERTRQKGEVLEDILQRFEDRLKAVQREQPAAKAASARKASTGSKPVADTRKAAGTGASKPAARGKATSPTTPRKTARTTASRALKNTQKLLADKQRRDMEPKAYRLLDAGPTERGSTPFTSETAATRSLELHAGESRMDAIHGSVSTHDRHNQGKRDSR